MKTKIKLFALIASFLAMLPSAWAGGWSATYSAYLTVKVRETGAGKVYASTSSTQPTADNYEEEMSVERSTDKSGSSGSAPATQNLTFYIYASPSPGYEFAGWTTEDKSATISDATNQSTTVTYAAPSGETPFTVTATYKKLTLPEFAVSFVIDQQGGIYTVDGAVPANKAGLTEAYTPKLVATPAANYAVKGWYTTTDGGVTKDFFSTAASCKGEFLSSVSVGVEFVSVVSVTDYAGLRDALQAGESMLSLNADVEIPFGEQVEIPEDTCLFIADGKMLTAKGKLVNNGKISGGSIAHSYITAVQEKTVYVPWVDGTDGPEGTKSGAFLTDGTSGKYLKTSLKNEDSLSGSGIYDNVDKGKVFATIDNQASGEKFASKISTTKPKAVLCTVAREKAANWINGVVELGAAVKQGSDETKEVYTTFGYALEACGYACSSPNVNTGYTDSYKMIVLLQDVTDGYKDKTDGSHTEKDGKLNAAQPRGAVDCAGKKLTITSGGDKINSGGWVKVFNCGNKSTESIFSIKMLTIAASFYNCIGKIGISGKTYICGYCFYDSPGVTITYPESKYQVDSTSAKNTLNFYGSDYCTTAYSQDLYYNTKNEYAVVYSGRYKASLNPGQNLVSKTKYEVVPVAEGSTDVKVVKKFDPDDAQIAVDGEPSALTFQEALDAASDSKLTVIALKKDIDLASNLVVPNGKKVRIDVYERKLTGDFKIINNGELEIIDMSGSADIGEVGVAIENNGELLLCDAIYNGSITLNGGKCYFVDGQFNGDIIVSGEVADVKSVAEVGGGSYAKTTYVHDDTTGNLKDLCVHRGYVTGSAPAYLIANIPDAEVKYDSSAAKFVARAFDADSTTLYEKRNLRDECTKDEWIAVRRLQASAEMFGGWSTDCAVVFDRLVPKAGFNITLSAYQFLGALDSYAEVAANSSYSAFLQALRFAPPALGGPFAPLGYSEFLPGGIRETDLDMTIDCLASTKGTSCDMEMRLANGVSTTSGPKDYSYKTWVVLGTCRFVFGAGTNKAMLQPTEGEATFFETLAKAVASDKTDGKTIKLCNDCSESVTVGKETSFTLDTNNFEFTGEIKPGDGYRIVNRYTMGTRQAIEIKAVSQDAQDDEPANSLEMTDEQRQQIGIGADATPSQIQQVLEARDGNTGLKNWEKIKVEQAKSNEDVAKIVVAEVVEFNENNQKVLETKESVDVSGGYASLPAGTYRKAYESTDMKGLPVAIADPDAPIVSVVKHESTEKTIILPVPGKKKNGNKVMVSEVIDPSSLTTGDSIVCCVGNVKQEWVYQDKKWSPIRTEAQGGAGSSLDDIELDPGSAFWLTRAKPENPVVVVGEMPPNEEIVATVADKEWNLEANPYPKRELELDSVVVNADDSDEILIPTENGAQKKATREDGGWVSIESYKDPETGRNKRQKVKAKIGGGQGFWYISNPQKASGTKTKIKWR